MTYQATFTGWDDLTIEDLLVAYRKAKPIASLRIHFLLLSNLPSMSRNYLKTCKTLRSFTERRWIQ